MVRLLLSLLSFLVGVLVYGESLGALLRESSNGVLQNGVHYKVSRHVENGECVVKQQHGKERDETRIKEPDKKSLMQLDFFCIKGSRAIKHRVDIVHKLIPGEKSSAKTIHTGVKGCERCVTRLSKSEKRNFLALLKNRQSSLRQRVEIERTILRQEKAEKQQKILKKQKERQETKDGKVLFSLNREFTSVFGDGNNDVDTDTSNANGDFNTSDNSSNADFSTDIADDSPTDDKTGSSVNSRIASSLLVLPPERKIVKFGPDTCLWTWKGKDASQSEATQTQTQTNLQNKDDEEGVCYLAGFGCEPAVMHSTEVGFGCVTATPSSMSNVLEESEEKAEPYYALTKVTYGVNSFASFVEGFGREGLHPRGKKSSSEVPLQPDFVFYTNRKCALCVGLDDELVDDANNKSAGNTGNNGPVNSKNTLNIVGKASLINKSESAKFISLYLMQKQIANLKYDVENVLENDIVKKGLPEIHQKLATVEKELNSRQEMLWGAKIDNEQEVASEGEVYELED